MDLFLGVLISFVVFFFFLHVVIKSAIDGSETADNIRQIRHILSTLHPDIPPEIDEEDINEESGVEFLSDDKCPACGANVSPDDGICPSCGLTLE